MHSTISFMAPSGPGFLETYRKVRSVRPEKVVSASATRLLLKRNLLGGKAHAYAKVYVPGRFHGVSH